MVLPAHYSCLNPMIDVTLVKNPIAPLVSRLGVVSDLLGKADICVLMVADYGRSFVEEIRKGDLMSVKRE